ncbi:MAG: ZIP family metal transporter, partial [Acidobacteria bacterium]|nr:ZIP family metal transporter [Acidobacteriota bacterium]
MPADPLLLSLVIIVAGLIAGVIPLFFTWSHFRAHQWIAIGAGMILGAAFLHMIPEALEIAGPRSLPAMLLGFLTLYLIEQIALNHHPHDEKEGAFHEIGLLTFIGISLHDLIDGVALGSGHHIPELTPAVFAAVVFGSLVGLVFGSIPGLTFSMALAFVLPLTFGLPAAPSIAMLMA